LIADASGQESKALRQTAGYLAALLILLGMGLRLWAACSSELWCDEAESSINALTILETGLPGSEYLGLPIYENTLTLKSPDSEEYEFKDSSYSAKGLSVYHGWLPLYSIALAQSLCGISPDEASASIKPKHSLNEIFIRTIAPRLPALIFAAAYLTLIFQFLRKIAGSTAALTALLWFSLNADAIDFGYQARYYSLTLLLSAACALAAWQVYKHGGWRDYLYLALAEAALFHTHQLSAVIFAATCTLLAPKILRQKNWPLKCTLAGGLAAALTVPWALWAGFFTTASEVPKAYHLFTSKTDWFNYLIERPTSLIMILTLIALYACTCWLRRNRPHNDLHAVITFLIVWMAVAFTAFHLLVPAASFFYERLTLIALTPFGCTFGIVISRILPDLGHRRSILFGGLAALLLMVLNKDLPRTPKSSNIDRNPIFQLLEALPERSENRIYATPSEQLVWTYYTGVPIQSIAPIRKSFLEGFTGRILYLETYPTPVMPAETTIQEAAQRAEIELSEATIKELQISMAKYIAQQSLYERGLSGAPTRGALMDTYLDPILKMLYDSSVELNDSSVHRIKKLIVFRDLAFDNINDLWISFFYRFVDPASRIGKNSNIRQIQEAADITLYPESRTILFLREQISLEEPEK
jgi:hypothetical protein